jgi:hypothetical protein
MLMAFVITIGINAALGYISDGEWFIFLEWLICLPLRLGKHLFRKSRMHNINTAMRERNEKIRSDAVRYIQMGFDKDVALSKAEKDLVAEANRTLNEINAVSS